MAHFLLLAFMCLTIYWVQQRIHANKATWEEPRLLTFFWLAFRSCRGNGGVLVLTGLIGLIWIFLRWGIDEQTHQFFLRYRILGDGIALPVVTLAVGWSIALSLVVYFNGKRVSSLPLRRLGVALFQGQLASGLLVYALKIFSGRLAPLTSDFFQPTRFLQKTDDPGEFRLDFWTSGLFAGKLSWPALSPTLGMAFLTVLLVLSPGQRLPVLLAIAWIVLYSLALVDSSSAWLSDVVAGLVLGGFVGWRVARYWQRSST